MIKKVLFTAGVILFLTLLTQVSFADGSQTYSTAGTYTFTVPSYATLTVEVWGGGGAGGGAGAFGNNGYSGYSGGASSFNGVVGNGGTGGIGSNSAYGSWGPYGTNRGDGGFGGTWSGGNSGEDGEDGEEAVDSTRSGAGGDAGGDGGDGGYSRISTGPGWNGGTPGGGGGGADVTFQEGGGGGGGGYATRTWSAGEIGAPTPGAGVTVTVGAGGLPNFSSSQDGGRGGAGEVQITWTNPVLPTCTLSLNPNPINQGGSSTLTWSSTDTTSFDITNIGTVDVPPGAGSTSVAPSATTVYTGTVNGPGGSGNCNATLTVNPATTANLIGNGEADDTVSTFQDTSISFSWSSTDAADCTLTKDPGTAPWSGGTTGTTGDPRTVGPYSTLGTYTYTLTCTGAGGSIAIDTVEVAVTPLDMCSDISGNQPILPGGCTGPNPSPVGACIPSGYYWSGAQCVLDVCTDIFGGQSEVPPGCTGPTPSPSGACLPPGYSWNGLQCVAPLPTLTTGTFYADRVRRGDSTLLHWDLDDITGTTCSISPDPTDDTGTYSIGTASGSVNTTVITDPKSYTLTCSNGSNIGSVTVTALPVPEFQEI